MLLECQESCIINGGNTTKYLKLQKGARQLHVYKSRERRNLELSRLINEIKKVKLLEKNSAQKHVRKLEQYNIKWDKTHRTIKI